jgi:hypothetical protein
MHKYVCREVQIWNATNAVGQATLLVTVQTTNLTADVALMVVAGLLSMHLLESFRTKVMLLIVLRVVVHSLHL